MNALLRFFTIFVFVSLCHTALATKKITAKNEGQFLLLEFDDEVFCKKARIFWKKGFLPKTEALTI